MHEEKFRDYSLYKVTPKYKKTYYNKKPHTFLDTYNILLDIV